MSQAALQAFMGVSIGFIHEKKKRNKGDHSPSNLSNYIRMSLSVMPTQESRWTPDLRDLSGKKHWQPDKSQASFYANPGVETKNWKGQNTLSTAFEWQQRGCSPVTGLRKVHRLNCQVPAVLRERKATAVLELNSPGRNLSQFLPLQAISFLVSSSATIPVHLWVFLQFQWRDAKSKWLQLPIISLNLPSTRVHKLLQILERCDGCTQLPYPN